MSPERAAALDAARAAISPGGPIRMVEVARLPGAIDLISCATRPARGDASAWSTAPGGSGVGLRWDDALLSTVGEAIERMALHPDDTARRQIRVGSYPSLAAHALDPCRFNHYHEAFYGAPDGPRLPFTHDEEIAWFPAVSLGRDRRTVSIPAESVFFSCEEVLNHHSFCTTSGVACQRSAPAALAGALYELVERDAFVSAWLRGAPLPAVDPGAFRDTDLDELVARCDRVGVSLHLRELGSDLEIPSYLAIAEARAGGEPAIGVGAASRLCGRSAARKAALEAVHTWNWAYLKVDARGLLGCADDLAAYPLRDFGDHVYLYAHAAAKHQVAFLLDDTHPRAPRFGAKALAAEREWRVLAQRFEAAGVPVYAVDQTPIDVAERGYIVVRAVAPELLPLQPGRRLARLRGGRVPACPNTTPHPFP